MGLHPAHPPDAPGKRHTEAPGLFTLRSPAGPRRPNTPPPSRHRDSHRFPPALQPAPRSLLPPTVGPPLRRRSQRAAAGPSRGGGARAALRRREGALAGGGLARFHGTSPAVRAAALRLEGSRPERRLRGERRSPPRRRRQRGSPRRAARLARSPPLRETTYAAAQHGSIL